MSASLWSSAFRGAVLKVNLRFPVLTAVTEGPRSWLLRKSIAALSLRRWTQLGPALFWQNLSTSEGEGQTTGEGPQGDTSSLWGQSWPRRHGNTRL